MQKPSNVEDILDLWREYFKYHLNPVTSTPLDTKELNFWKENTITAAEVFLAVKTLKVVKIAGCDEIWP